MIAEYMKTYTTCIARAMQLACVCMQNGTMLNRTPNCDFLMKTCSEHKRLSYNCRIYDNAYNCRRHDYVCPSESCTCLTRCARIIRVALYNYRGSGGPRKRRARKKERNPCAARGPGFEGSPQGGTPPGRKKINPAGGGGGVQA